MTINTLFYCKTLEIKLSFLLLLSDWKEDIIQPQDSKQHHKVLFEQSAIKWNDLLLKCLDFLLHEEVLGCAHTVLAGQGARGKDTSFTYIPLFSSHPKQQKWSTLTHLNHFC